MYKKTSIILLAYKEPKKFKKMFNIIISNTNKKITPYEIIVVNNNADKEIMDFLKDKDIKILNPGKNLGVARGYNYAIKKSKGYYLCFFNCDYYMMDNWLQSMIDCFEHKPKIGMISCCTNHTANPNERVYCKFDGKFADVSLPGDYKESDYAIAQMFTNRKIFDELKGFDPFYFVHWEDVDINEKIKSKGYKIFVNRKCFGYHDFDAEKLKGRVKIDAEGREHFNKKWKH